MQAGRTSGVDCIYLSRESELDSRLRIGAFYYGSSNVCNGRNINELDLSKCAISKIGLWSLMCFWTKHIFESNRDNPTKSCC
jgi:hypothetical protein